MNHMPRLLVVIASTRPGRAGLPIGTWFADHARTHGAFEIEVADLAEIALPFMDEPNHPRLRDYTKDHTKRWSATVDAANALVFVTPEYNYGFTAPLKNAIDFLHHEWADKAIGFVSYGGVAAGTRAVQMLKQVVTVLRMTPVQESVNIPFFFPHVTEDGFRPPDGLAAAADAMLDELARVEHALAVLRDNRLEEAAS